jgi:hypothetical protein
MASTVAYVPRRRTTAVAIHTSLSQSNSNPRSAIALAVYCFTSVAFFLASIEARRQRRIVCGLRVWTESAVALPLLCRPYPRPHCLACSGLMHAST